MALTTPAVTSSQIETLTKRLPLITPPFARYDAGKVGLSTDQLAALEKAVSTIPDVFKGHVVITDLIAQVQSHSPSYLTPQQLAVILRVAADSLVPDPNEMAELEKSKDVTAFHNELILKVASATKFAIELLKGSTSDPEFPHELAQQIIREFTYDLEFLAGDHTPQDTGELTSSASFEKRRQNYCAGGSLQKDNYYNTLGKIQGRLKHYSKEEINNLRGWFIAAFSKLPYTRNVINLNYRDPRTLLPSDAMV